MEATTLCQELLEGVNEDDSAELGLLRGEDWDDEDWDSLAGGHGFGSESEDFCSIKFYKMQYAQGRSSEFLPPGRYPIALRERSIRTFGECCWKVVR